MYRQLLITRNSSKNVFTPKNKCQFWCLILNNQGRFEYLCKSLEINDKGSAFKTTREAIGFVKKRFIVKRFPDTKFNCNLNDYHYQVSMMVIKDLYKR